jgi:ribosome biogenesis GTPase
MEPIAVWIRPDDEWALVHRCLACQALKTNRISGDDNEFVLLSLAARPMAQPPFPLHPLARGGRIEDEDAECEDPGSG